MARGRKGGPSRLDLRRENEAAEARERDDEADVEEAEEADDADGGDDDGKSKPKAKAKKKAEPKPKAAPKRPRAAKEVRMKAVWVVFDNSSKRVEAFPFNQKADAEALLARKAEEKKGTYYIQLVKEPIEG